MPYFTGKVARSLPCYVGLFGPGAIFYWGLPEALSSAAEQSCS